ncbi:hypothetical protein C943_00859 [Mariniradius saccharolyticus AK6]|uniref:Uncharacterized protein n=1 Tax=Mariniradius saccharolyticus AK6 TaxID=1239962 RepID=M7XE95_9BACT|nr:hypothetical protein C943_00859 [Mariniradius saccharolyticus AK6]
MDKSENWNKILCRKSSEITKRMPVAMKKIICPTGYTLIPNKWLFYISIERLGQDPTP